MALLVYQMNKNYITIALCLLLIGVLVAYIFRPAPKPEIVGDLTAEQENALKENVLILEGENDSLRQELGKSKVAGIEAAKVFKIEIKTKVKTIAELKARPVVIQLVQETPELDSLHRTYDSAMVAYEGRTVALTMEMQMRDKIASQLVVNFEQRLADTERLLADKIAENEELKGENKKLRRRLTLTKIGGVILLGGVIALSL